MASNGGREIELRGDARAIAEAGAPQELIKIAQIDPEIAQRAFAIILSNVVDQWHPAIQPARAIAAALYEKRTGQVCGRDFYVDNRMGVVPGYRGRVHEAETRGISDYIDEYRPFSVDEARDHEVKAGDTAKICELTVISRAKACREAGVPFRPVIGFGIVRAAEKVSKDGKPIALSGGYTWDRRARNRALKDALSHAGYARDAKELIEDAERAALDLGMEAESLAKLDRDQAAYVVERAQKKQKAAARQAEDEAQALLARVAEQAVEGEVLDPDDDGGDDPVDGEPSEDELYLVGVQAALIDAAGKGSEFPPQEGILKNARGALSVLFGSDEATAKAVLKWAFDVDSSGGLTDGQARSIMGFVSPTKVQGQWVPSDPAVAFLDCWKRVHAQPSLFGDEG